MHLPACAQSTDAIHYSRLCNGSGPDNVPVEFSQPPPLLLESGGMGEQGMGRAVIGRSGLQGEGRGMDLGKRVHG